MKFITKDDDWGIRITLKEIFFGKQKECSKDAFFEFDLFFNQYMPPAYYETKSTILRHLDEIRELLERFHKEYKIGLNKCMWIEKSGQYQCAIITDDLLRQLKSGLIRLPTYLEIEEEKKRWQNTLGYNKEQGFSDPIKEEMIQLNFKRR